MLGFAVWTDVPPPTERLFLRGFGGLERRGDGERRGLRDELVVGVIEGLLEGRRDLEGVGATETRGDIEGDFDGFGVMDEVAPKNIDGVGVGGGVSCRGDFEGLVLGRIELDGDAEADGRTEGKIEGDGVVEDVLDGLGVGGFLDGVRVGGFSDGEGVRGILAGLGLANLLLSILVSFSTLSGLHSARVLNTTCTRRYSCTFPFESVKLSQFFLHSSGSSCKREVQNAASRSVNLSPWRSRAPAHRQAPIV